MLTLNDAMRAIIFETTGKTVEELEELDLDEEIALVTRLRGTPPIFSKKRDWRMIPRGNPYLAEGRITTMEEIDRRIEEVLR